MRLQLCELIKLGTYRPLLMFFPSFSFEMQQAKEKVIVH